MMRLLELFAGSRSVGKVAGAMGWQVFSVDVHPFDDIDLVKDIAQITRQDIPFVPDVIWASPVCTTYSIAAISHHRNGTEPKSDEAKVADRLLLKTLEIIGLFPSAKFFIENPRGMMRKMPILQNYDRATVWYCKYGDTRAKPTDIWSNHIGSVFVSGWQPRPMCFNGNTDCHHQPAPRGSRTGTQGLKGSYERSKIPKALIEEILRSCL